MDEKKISEQASELMGGSACAHAQVRTYEPVATDALEAAAFVGQTLAPYFLNDPSSGVLDAALDAMAQLDVEAAAGQWPFAEEAQAAEALALMREGAATRAADAGEAIKWEYRRLFVGPAAMPTPPWGSVYTDRDCVCFGGTTLELRAWMRAHGIKRLTDAATPEDHIGELMALMAWIATEKPELLCEFLELHVLTWSGRMLGQMAQAAQHPFFEGLAQLTNASLTSMGEAFCLEPKTPRFYR